MFKFTNVCEVLHTKQKVLNTDVYCFVNNAAFSENISSPVGYKSEINDISREKAIMLLYIIVHIPEDNEMKLPLELFGIPPIRYK